MYKLIIVDDEEDIREGLHDMIDWMSLGFQVVEKFEDGREVLAYLAKHPVDVILTDIKMTFVSGLELAQHVHKNKLPIKVVILSGFQEFALAREAIQYDVSHYLLKPTNLEEVYRIFRSMYEQLNQEKRERELQQHQRQHYNTLFSLLMEQFFYNLIISGAWSKDSGELRIRLQQMGLPVDPDRGACCVIQADWTRSVESALSVGVSTGGNTEELHALSLAITKEREQVHYTCIHMGSQRLIIVGTTLTEIGADELESRAERYFIHLQSSLFSLLGLSIRLEKLKSYTHMHEMLTEGDYGPGTPAWTTEGESVDLKETVMGLLETMRDELNAPDLEDSMQELSQLEEHGQIADWCRQMFAILHNPNQDMDIQLDHERMIITQAKQYIIEHLNDELTLAGVSNHVSLNPVYFSRLFKQETGQTYSDFVISLRMKRAMDYLKDPTIRVYEIGLLVGYRNAKHFQKLFKRFTGMTPSEYRES